MQKITIMGFVGKDPYEKMLPSGKKVTSFTMAVSTKKGSEQETSWYDIKCWGNSFENILTYIKKGKMLVIAGSLNPPSTYAGTDGKTKVSLSISCDSITFTPTQKPFEEKSANAGFEF